MSEQEFIERIIAGDMNALLYSLDLCIQEQAEDDEPRQPEGAADATSGAEAGGEGGKK